MYNKVISTRGTVSSNSLSQLNCKLTTVVANWLCPKAWSPKRRQSKYVYCMEFKTSLMSFKVLSVVWDWIFICGLDKVSWAPIIQLRNKDKRNILCSLTTDFHSKVCLLFPFSEASIMEVTDSTGYRFLLCLTIANPLSGSV